MLLLLQIAMHGIEPASPAGPQRLSYSVPFMECFVGVTMRLTKVQDSDWTSKYSALVTQVLSTDTFSLIARSFIHFALSRLPVALFRCCQRSMRVRGCLRGTARHARCSTAAIWLCWAASMQRTGHWGLKHASHSPSHAATLQRLLGAFLEVCFPCTSRSSLLLDAPDVCQPCPFPVLSPLQGFLLLLLLHCPGWRGAGINSEHRAHN